MPTKKKAAIKNARPLSSHQKQKFLMLGIAVTVNQLNAMMLFRKAFYKFDRSGLTSKGKAIFEKEINTGIERHVAILKEAGIDIEMFF